MNIIKQLAELGVYIRSIHLGEPVMNNLHHYNLLKIPTLFICLFWLATSQATILVDQHHSGSDIPASFSSEPLVQSFTPTKGNIVGAGVDFSSFISCTGPVGPGNCAELTISLFDANPSDASAALLASNSTFLETSPSVNVFWSSVSIDPGTILFLAFTLTPHVASESSFSLTGTSFIPLFGQDDPYAAGQGFISNGTNSGSFIQWDFSFRSFYDDNLQMEVPEPSSISLLLIGLVWLGLSRSKWGAR